MLKKLAIITTHPIQYYAPVFRLLNNRGVIQPKVFYTWEHAQHSQYDPGFGKIVQWDIPLLEGYEYTFVRNTAHKPGSSHFRGIINPTLVQEIEIWEPDAILVFGWSYWSHLKVLCHFKGKIPLLFRGDSHLLDSTEYIRQIARQLLLTWVYKHIDFALYVGQNNRDYYLKFGLKPKQLIWAPHAIDNLRFQLNDSQLEANAKELRYSLGIPSDALVFLFAGKFENKKNPALLLKSFQQANITNAYLIFAGNGPLEADLKQQTMPNANVRWLDFQNQSIMPVVYRVADVFVLPSQGPGETWGLAINEAMACGKAIIASDKVGCAIDLVKAGENGYIFKSGKGEELADLLIRIEDKFNDHSLVHYQQKSLNIISHWSFDILCDNLEASIIKSISERP